MKQGHQPATRQDITAALAPLAPQFGYATPDANYALQCRGARQQDQRRIHQGDLAIQPGPAGGHFRAGGLAVVGGATLHHIADV